MRLVQQDFSERATEIENYFNFIKSVADGNTLLLAKDKASAAMTQEQFESLVKTLKANGFILLYNLIESTMKNAVEAIFEEFGSKNVCFDDCREEVRKIVISNLKSHNPDRIFGDLKPIAQKVLTETFRKEKAFAGNVDAQKIRDVAKNYGFKRPTSKGDNLLTVKTNRNDLAHGDKAFSEVGRDYDVGQVIEIKDEVVTYLNELLANVSEYLTNRTYLIPVTTTPPVIAPVAPPSNN